jgi:putative RNA 2'-phosphotransferase
VTEPVFRCPTHGYLTSSRCPDCGRETERVLSERRRVRLSKFLSGALRHFPGDVGLSLSAAGWAAWEAVITAVAERYPWADERHVAAVVETDPKGRFEVFDDRDGRRVRARYGHSVPVVIDGSGSSEMPDRLYHGTAPRNVASILAEGLKPMDRQEVHLSGTVSEAREVGRRHASNSVVLVVDAAAMLADGRRIDSRGRETYTTDRVPPRYLDRLDADR